MSSNEQPGAGTEVIPLETIRRKNFKFICNIIKEKFPQAKTILDVGCSSGLFLEIARDEGFLVTGLEPAEHLVKETLSRGFDVINGFFPQTENLLNKKYDIIVFNDSFEHIPNLQEVLHGIKTYLTDKGCAIINIPTSEGLVFKIASILYKFRIKTPYHRMWQKGFPSPHLHYFNLQNLRKLFENNGFAMHYSSPIQYFTIQGLWKRISGKSLFIVSISTWLFMILLYPLLSIRSDTIMACFSLKKEST
jgi:2-polyprenyl-3-methyl-5-hydroxy-6-metoxy-1,4-benzoquinol methylase